MGMIQSHYIYCALNFYYYYIGSTSDDQSLDPEGWGPLAQTIWDVFLHESSEGGEFEHCFSN